LKPDMVDFESCANDFETFLILQDRELKSIANTANLSWYISRDTNRPDPSIERSG
jgi:hypothetical protein